MSNTQGGPLEFEFDLKIENLEKKIHMIQAQLGTMSNTAVKQASMADKAWTGIMTTAGAYFTGQTIGRFILKLGEVRGEFQKLEAILTNSFGDSSRAKQALSMIQEFASKTPFQVIDLTNSFVKLVNQGFEPTIEEMTSLGDLASSTGKGFDQLTEAIIDAQTMEFERLKEFGIRASKEGDKITFTFKNQKTTVDATNDSIRTYILSLGKMEGVTGAMEAISKTIPGQISNMKDAWEQMLNTIGTKSEGAFSTAIGWLADLITMIDGASKSMEQIEQGLDLKVTSENVEKAKVTIKGYEDFFIKSGDNIAAAKKKALDKYTKEVEESINSQVYSLYKAENELNDIREKRNKGGIVTQLQGLFGESDLDKQIVKIDEETKKLAQLRSELKAIQSLQEKGGVNKPVSPADEDKVFKEFEKMLAGQKKAYQQFEAVKATTSLENAKRLYPKLEESYKLFLLKLREKYADNPAFAGVIATELAPFSPEFNEQLETLSLIEARYTKQKGLIKDITAEKWKHVKLEDLSQDNLDSYNEKLMRALEIYDQMASAMGQLVSAIMNFGTEADEATQQLNKGLANMSNAVKSKSVWEGLAKFVVQLGIDMINFYSERAVKAIQTEADVFQAEINRIQASIDSIDLTTGKQKNEQYLSSLKDIAQKIEELKNGYLTLQDSGRRGIPGLTSKEQVDEIANLIQMYEVLAATMVGKGDKEWAQAEIKKLEDLRDFIFQQQELLNDYYSNLTGSSVDSIVSSISQGFQDGLSAVIDFADRTEDIIRKALVRSFETKYLESQLQNWYNSFGKAAESGGELTNTEIQTLQEQLSTVISTASEGWDQLSDILDNMGISSGDQASSLAGAFKGITEDTANVLAGQMNAMRIVGIRQLEVQQSSFGVLQRIDYNTSFTQTVVEELRAMRSAGGSEGGLVTNRASGR